MTEILCVDCTKGRCGVAKMVLPGDMCECECHKGQPRRPLPPPHVHVACPNCGLVFPSQLVVIHGDHGAEVVGEDDPRALAAFAAAGE